MNLNQSLALQPLQQLVVSAGTPWLPIPTLLMTEERSLLVSVRVAVAPEANGSMEVG